MYRVNNNPESRYPVGRSLMADCGNWAVAHLKSRREKAFVMELAKEGIGYYLPLFEKRTRRKDNGKIRKSVLPLFSGYVACVSPENMSQVIKRTHVTSILKIADQNEFILELSHIQRILDNNIPFETHPKLQSGKRVRVLVGPLSGMEGVIIKRRKNARLYTSVEFFNQSVSIDIKEMDVEYLS